MNNERQINQLRSILAKHRGKFGYVIFTKTNGKTRKMNFRQGVKNGTTPLAGGEWANGRAGSAKQHKLALVTDIDLEKIGGHSRRSISLDKVKYLKIGGEVWNG